MVQAVWPRSSQLLGWGCVASQLLVLVGPGSSQPRSSGWFKVCGRGLVSCVAGQLLGWFRLYGQGLGGSGCVAGV